MQTPYFSVIIPTFNAEKDLERCLNSIINQTYTEKEIIIIDGNSTDGTIRILEKYSDLYPYIKYCSGQDRGIYDAMNIGISKANGDWLYFLGSDDSLFDENILEMINYQIFLENKSKFIYGDVLTSACVVQKYPEYNYRKLINLNICHQAIFYHKSLFEKRKYNLKYPICADWDFNLKVFRTENNPVYINKTIARFNLKGASKDWRTHPDYLENFNNPQMILRYRSKAYFLYIAVLTIFRRIRGRAVYKLSWIFR